MGDQPNSKDYGAIGSERKNTKTSNPQGPPQPRGHGRRPSSWQDEIGNTVPNIPKSIGKLEPFDIESPRSPQKYTRSTSFPESSPPYTSMRLTQTRSHGHAAGYDRPFAARAKDVGQAGLIPPSHREEDSTTAGAAPDASFHNLNENSLDFVTSAPSHRNVPQMAGELDTLGYALDSMSLRETISRGSTSSGKAAYPSNRRQALQSPARDEHVGFLDHTASSPTFGPPEPDWEMARRMSSYPGYQLRDQAQELATSPSIRDRLDRRNHSLLHVQTPQTPEQARQSQLSDAELACLRLRDEVRQVVPDSEYPFLDGGPPNFNIAEYPVEVQKVLMSKSGDIQSLAPNMIGSDIQTRPENVYIVVVFKLHRASIYYRPEDMIFASEIKRGDMIVVQADRGEDVGFVWKVTANVLEAEDLARQLNTEHLRNLLSFVKLYTGAATRLARNQLPGNYGQDLVFKSIVRKAGGPEGRRLLDKEHDETKAKRIAEQKARERGLPMEILDAEFQADHGKLTIYYISEQYIVFKEFVDDMYKVYKMRVWMSSVNQVRPSR